MRNLEILLSEFINYKALYTRKEYESHPISMIMDPQEIKEQKKIFKKKVIGCERNRTAIVSATRISAAITPHNLFDDLIDPLHYMDPRRVLSKKER